MNTAFFYVIKCRLVALVLKQQTRPFMKNASFYAESILVISVLFYWFSTSTLLNPIAIIILLILLAQMYFKNNISGLILPVCIGFISLYMLLAIISELNEFPSFDSNAQIMAVVGLPWIVITLLAATTILLSYIKKLE